MGPRAAATLVWCILVAAVAGGDAVVAAQPTTTLRGGGAGGGGEKEGGLAGADDDDDEPKGGGGGGAGFHECRGINSRDALPHTLEQLRRATVSYTPYAHVFIRDIFEEVRVGTFHSRCFLQSKHGSTTDVTRYGPPCINHS
jgi:hypothetical protein